MSKELEISNNRIKRLETELGLAPSDVKCDELVASGTTGHTEEVHTEETTHPTVQNEPPEELSGQSETYEPQSNILERSPDMADAINSYQKFIGCPDQTLPQLYTMIIADGYEYDVYYNTLQVLHPINDKIVIYVLDGKIASIE